jgi:aminoglycoside phosphotransferase (APT) family kinase protein
MIELNEYNAREYLRDTGRSTGQGELLVQSLSGGVANNVLKCFDMGAGERVGTDLRTEEELAEGQPDIRPHQGMCFVLKQPLARFRTEAEWLVDIERGVVEREVLELLATLLPAGSVPRVLWYDEANHVMALSCAPLDAVIWKKALLEGQVSTDAATHAGMLLAMMHSSTHNDAALHERYGNPRFFMQQRIDPYLRHTAAQHPAEAGAIEGVIKSLLTSKLCLIHGDYSPKNIFLIPGEPEREPGERKEREERAERGAKAMPVGQLMLLDFEVAFFGNPAFDVATLINHFLLKGFHRRGGWRPYMMLADTFSETYRHTAAPALVRTSELMGGHVLGALMLARVDGKSPVEYLEEAARQQVRAAAKALLGQGAESLEAALDTVAGHFDEPR